jgi:hypothetical protein
VRAREEPQGFTGGHNPWAVALTVTLATFMEVLDTSIANVSLPHIAGNLSVSPDESPGTPLRRTDGRGRHFFADWCSANAAPSGSVSCATRPPPGTSSGPCRTFAPFFLARPSAASRSPVSV